MAAEVCDSPQPCSGPANTHDWQYGPQCTGCTHLSGGKLLGTARLLSHLCICCLLRCLRLLFHGLRRTLQAMDTMSMSC